MGGRHRFAGEDRTVRPLLAAVVPVIAVAGMTVAVMLGSNGEATSTPRIEVPRFSSSDGVVAAPTTAGLPAALPTGAPAVLRLSGAGTSAVQRVVDERAAAAARAEQERAAEARAAAQAARDRAAQQEADRSRAAVPAPPRAEPLPAAPAPRLRATEQPDTTGSTPSTPANPSTPERSGGLLGSLLGGG